MDRQGVYQFVGEDNPVYRINIGLTVTCDFQPFNLIQMWAKLVALPGCHRRTPLGDCIPDARVDSRMLELESGENITGQLPSTRSYLQDSAGISSAGTDFLGTSCCVAVYWRLK